jgi:hypothetical protein
VLVLRRSKAFGGAVPRVTLAAMSLVGALREIVGDAGTPSFRLMGEDLALLPGASLRRAAALYEEALARDVPKALHTAFELEQASFLRESHAFLRRHNRNMHARVRGYLELARACRFEYPWPVVAILGVCQVMGGIERNHAYGVLGRAARGLGYGDLERLIDGIDDVLRRTNRGIFADSVPTVLFALRCRALREAGQGALADALLRGPAPLLMDEETRAIAGALCDGLVIPNDEARFQTLAELTARHFAREQAIFTHHLGSGRGSRGVLARLTTPRRIPAPIVVQTSRGRRVVFRPYALPPGFRMTDHDARVEVFRRAFVRSVTADRADYQAAARYAEARFA